MRICVLAALFAERRQAEARLQEALAAGSVRALECNFCSGLKVTTVRTGAFSGRGSRWGESPQAESLPSRSGRWSGLCQAPRNLSCAEALSLHLADPARVYWDGCRHRFH
jgi:hypothetical protein